MPGDSKLKGGMLREKYRFVMLFMWILIAKIE